MRFGIVLIMSLLLSQGCSKSDKNAKAALGNSSTPSKETIYSYVDPAHPNSYQSFTLRDDATFEYFMTFLVNDIIVGWAKFEGSYVINGSTLTITTVLGEKNNFGMNCSDPLGMSYDYIETVSSIILNQGQGQPLEAVLDDEAFSGISKPDVSSLPNECP